MVYDDKAAKHIIQEEYFEIFVYQMREDERSEGTIENYIRHVRLFAEWLDGNSVTKYNVNEWKMYLISNGYVSSTINAMLCSLNAFLRVMGWEDCRVKLLKIQRRLFREPEKELTREEYEILLKTAIKTNQKRLAMLIETICATGIRVSEVKYITVEALQKGRAKIALKGKIRDILFPKKLWNKLSKYIKSEKITFGEIFITENGKSISRKQIWAEMKELAKLAGVAASKVFPHNLRHLFARVFYKNNKDVAKLADVLGHSSIETTRIYLISTGEEHVKEMERLGLII
ncbi:MAG: tyrosine-type recombinase/integrase [Firmicutes bacterium]|nr:tyrosine-type recombinase/integrase [Bacillota bacterium]